MNSIRLTVKNCSVDNYYVYMSKKILDQFAVTNSLVIIKGKCKRKILASVVADYQCSNEDILMSEAVRKNLRVSTGDSVRIYKCNINNYGQSIEISPIEVNTDNLLGLSDVQRFLGNYFSKYPAYEGNLFEYKGNSLKIEFKITKTYPSPYCRVGQTTVFNLNSIPISRKELEKETENEVGYDDIAGMDGNLSQIREILSIFSMNQNNMIITGFKPPKKILLHGPSGTGKTLVGRAIENETSYYFCKIDIDRVRGSLNDTTNFLFQTSEIVKNNSRSIVFIDGIDEISSKETETDILFHFNKFINQINELESVIIIATAKEPNLIDPLFNKFDKLIRINKPNNEARRKILLIHTKKMNLDQDVDLKEITKFTSGYVGADLVALCYEASLEKLRESVSSTDLQDDENNFSHVLKQLKITKKNFLSAIHNFKSNRSREKFVETPDTTFEDIGGLDEYKIELKAYIENRIKHKKRFLDTGITPCGILLVGQSGCGKTLLVKSLTNECDINLVTVQGTDLLNIWLGKCDYKLSDIFDKTRQISPCILFFDGLELIKPSKTNDDATCILNQLLNEIDKIKPEEDIFVFAASNKLDIFDSSVLKPGRFDKIFDIPLPDFEARKSILTVLLSKSSCSNDLNYDDLAGNTKNFSGAELLQLCKLARELAIHKFNENLENKTVQENQSIELNKQDFDEALEYAKRREFDLKADVNTVHGRSSRKQITRLHRMEMFK